MMASGPDSELRAYESGCVGAVLLDADMQITAVSAGIETIGGYDGASLVGRSALDVVHPDDLERAAEALVESAAAPGPSAEGLYRLRFSDHTYHDYAVAATSLGPERGNVTVFQFRDVTPRLRIEEFARDTVDTMRMLAESPRLNVCLERVHHLAERHIQGAQLEITTFDESGLATVHRRCDDGSFIASDGPSELPCHVQNAFDEQLRGPWRAFHRMATFLPQLDGEFARGLVTSALIDDNNKLIGFVDTTRPGTNDPDEHEWMVHGLVRQVLTVLLRRVGLDEKLRHAAEQDPLTGLANRRKLFDDMASHGDLAGTTLLLLDLDRFSGVNNTLGHHLGDEVLVALAAQLREVCPPDATIARFGGDEFVIWLSAGCEGIDDVATTIAALQISADNGSDPEIDVHSSVGVVTLRADESPTEAIRRADAAMYVAKRRGGNGVCVA